jgi:hypothetical protein
MATLEIPTLTDGTVTYDHRADIEGTEYLLTFQWNARRERWTFSINGLDGADILTGQTVSLGIPLNRRAVGGPPGVFMATSTSDDVAPPGLTELGARVRLLYVEASTAAEQGL